MILQLDSTLLILVIGGVFLVGFFMFCLGKLFTLQRQSTDLSVLSVIASIYAAGEARAITKAPLIRQIVERHIPVNPEGIPLDAKALEAASHKLRAAGESEWNKQFGFEAPTPKTPTNSIKPEHTV